MGPLPRPAIGRGTVFCQSNALGAQAPSCGRRVGFTLLEVILALGLGLVLLTAVYAALHLHWKYSTAGRIEVERSQLARAMLEKVALDIRCVIYQEPAWSDEFDDMLAGDGGAPMGTMSLTAALDAGEALGVFGDSHTLMLHVSRVTRGMNHSPLLDGQAVMSRSSDLKSVSYFLAGTAAGPLQDAVAGMVLDDGSGKFDQDGRGLVRMEGDLLDLQQADMFGDMLYLADQAEMLASEVTYLQFRYFDGAVWLDEWDSTFYQALPRAIEIVLGFEPLEDDLALLPGNPASASTNVYRLVVAVPLAQASLSEVNL